tara:strand:+ start:12066 stop:12407 length:342 start_codon:yes stop_codon:yes gene_type:complete
VKPSFLAFACLLTSLSIPAAQASDDPQYLIQSCQELVDAYTDADQLSTIAKVASSFSEALRAGYCMGRVDEYRRSYECATDDWFEQAARIVDMPESLSVRPTVDELLEYSCAG